MRNIIGNGGLQSVGLISGSVADYASLPTPASAYSGQFWLTRTGSGGLLSSLGVYKYPKGLYSPNASNAWELVPLNVKVAEDSTTLVNVTNWTEFVAYAFDISEGDRLIFNNITFVNTTGTMTSSDPEIDKTNWNADLTISSSFSGLLGTKITNTFSGATGVAGAVHQMTNDEGYWALVGMTNSGSTIGGGAFANTFQHYNQGYNNSLFTVDGNKAFVFYSDPTDSHNFTALTNEIMRLTALGELQLTGFETEEDGTWVNSGDGTCWEDIQNSLLGRRLTSTPGTLDYNWAENTISAAPSGDIDSIDDRAVFNFQYPHSAITDGEIRLHVHWEQTDATNREFTTQYRIQNNGAAKTTAWTEVVTLSTPANNVFTYVSGTLNQITNLLTVDMTDIGTSSVVQFRFTRTDAVAGNIELTFVDGHYERDMNGSRGEYTK